VKKYYVRKEALVWNAMQIGMGVAMGLLNGQTTKQDSIVSVKEFEGGVVYRAGFRIRNRIDKCTWVMSQKFLGSQ
jgi:hypothetical protein